MKPVVHKTDPPEVHQAVRERLLEAMSFYKQLHGFTHKEMSDVAQVSVHTMKSWTMRIKNIPWKKFEVLIRRFELNRNEILGRDKVDQNIYFKEFSDCGDQYALYHQAGKTKEAIQVLRRAGSTIFEIVHNHGFLVDCTLTNRLRGCQDMVQLAIFVGDKPYFLELRPERMLAYRFFYKHAGTAEVLHDGAFCNSVLTAILDFLEQEQRRHKLFVDKEKNSATTFLDNFRKLENRMINEP
jgi:hypothetical protein